jgi:hypothetical protein
LRGRGIERTKIFGEDGDQDDFVLGLAGLAEEGLFTVLLGYPGAKVARVLGVTTSAVIRAVQSEVMPGVEIFLSTLRNNVLYFHGKSKDIVLVLD